MNLEVNFQTEINKSKQAKCDGFSFLHKATMEGNLELVKYLISEGANIESKDNDNFTPLHFAALEGHLNIVEYLLSEGANIECKTFQNGTPLHIASYHG